MAKVRKSIFLFTMCCFLTLATANVWADKFSDASSAYKGGDYKTALNTWQQLANEGHLQAQFNIAYMYEFGIEVNSDYQEAVQWYTKAATNGYARAQNFLGWLYETGKGVKQDRVTAIKWLKLAANQGSEDAIADLRLVTKRHERDQDKRYKQALYEVLKEEILKSEGRYYRSKLPSELDASNTTY